MDTGLRGKSVLVTGGASGIGLGISTVLAKEGMDVAIASRSPDPKVKSDIEAFGVRCELIPADVAKPEDVKNMVSTAEEAFGSIDCFVNNAAWTWHQPFTKITLDAWENTMNTNLRGCMLACKYMSKAMIRRQAGNIIIIGSTVRMFSCFCETSYRVSKTGLKVMMETIAVELAPHGIRVNMVTPGHFVTRMTQSIQGEALDKLHAVTPCGRSGNPEEIGNAVAFLLSDKLSAFTYGADLVIDGGITLHALNPPTKEEIRQLNIDTDADDDR